MKKASSPVLVTLMLSAAAATVYLAYRSFMPEPSEPAVSGQAAEPGLAEGLPQFTLADLNGDPLSIDSWPGKPLLINFWATWCAPCLREIPMLKAFQEEHPGVQVIGVAVDRAELVQSFAEEMQFNYPIMIGQADAMDAAAAFGVDFFALPFSVFTAADGSLLGVKTGEIHQEHLDNLAGVLTDLNRGHADIETARRQLAGFL